MHWLVEDAPIDGAELSVARMTLNEGARSERHRHPNCNEVIHLIQGTVEQSVGTERFIMEAGDTVFIPQGSVHGSNNIGRADATMIVCYSAGSRAYEAAGDNEPHER
jgi:quercetin dioxygenase-like cupin family protein